MQKILKFFTSRVFIVSFLIFLQLSLLSFLLIFISWLFIPIYLLFMVIGFGISIAIIDRNCNHMFKIAWIIPILSFPIFGTLFYILFGRTHLNKKNTEKLKCAIDSADGIIKPDEELLARIRDKNGHLVREANYIIHGSRTNIYENTATSYLAPGQVFFTKQLEELKKAEHYIFLEYFIIGQGRMWNDILEILKEKIKCGVEVWLMYDDFGCINNLTLEYPAELRELGIKVAVFNPYKPSLDKFLNYRDHRKFTIVDGKVAFTGGINLADEYINEKDRFGYWEDASVMLRGDAVKKIVVLFLQMWYFATNELPDYDKYMIDFKSNADGYVIPFSDEPLFQELVCENAYINVIDNAQKYVYICTPYLILDDVMTAAITRAAKSGIDVRIITPHKPDKKLVFLMTRSNYAELLGAGVKIYEFTPGFMHTKEIISDDKTAIVGSCNFDYRSFYLHFENGIWMHKSKAVIEARESFLRNMSLSQQVTQEYVDGIFVGKRILCSVLKVFAPLM